MAHQFMLRCGILITRLFASSDNEDGAMLMGNVKAVDRRFLDMEGYGSEPLVASKEDMVN